MDGIREFQKDKLTVKVMATRAEMGRVAARDIHDRILALLTEKDVSLLQKRQSMRCLQMVRWQPDMLISMEISVWMKNGTSMVLMLPLKVSHHRTDVYSVKWHMQNVEEMVLT